MSLITVISYYCNLVTFQTITLSYKLLVTKQVTSYITNYFKSNQLRNLVTKVTSYPQLCKHVRFSLNRSHKALSFASCYIVVSHPLFSAVFDV